MESNEFPDAAAFVAAFERLTEGYEILSVENEDEGHFSWRACQTCGTTLGGTRYDAELVHPGCGQGPTMVRSVKSCTDCVMFAANGALPQEWRVR